MKNQQQLQCIVLAGGEEHRFESSVPRILQPVLGTPILEHVLKTVELLQPDRLVVVTKTKEIENYVGRRASTVYQPKIKGSGDALYHAKSHIENFDGDVLVVYGDRPLLKQETLEQLVARGQEPGVDCAILTVHMDHPEGNGRIIRNQTGDVRKTGRDCDLPLEETKIQEVVAGAYFFKRTTLLECFEKIDREAARVFVMLHITDWIAHHGRAIAVKIPDLQEVMGIYSDRDIAEIEGKLTTVA